MGYQEMFKERVATLASECFFEKPNPQYKCTPNGPSVSASDYLLCRFEQSLSLGPSGTVQRNASSQKLATATLAGLQALVDQIQQGITDTPFSSAADVLTRYGAQLANYRFSGVDARTFVATALNECFTKANLQATSESNRPDTELGMARRAGQ
jgi:hypothetical protein